MARLERTDKPVSVLLGQLTQGELGLPEIQRGYVWNRPQARDLIDSLYRHYPSGLILLWKPDELPQLRGNGSQSRGETTPTYLVLDGQQRLTSLKRVFEGQIKVYFNVQDETFQIYSAKLKANPFWIPVADVLREGAVKMWRRLKGRLVGHGPREVEESDLDEYLERLSRLEKIKDYLYPVMILHTDDYEEITESFIRVNSKGTRLREAELAMAQLALRWPGAIVQQFEAALDEYEQVNYDLEARFLMRCFVAVGTGQSRFRYLRSLWKKSQAELERIWQKTKDALDQTINFLKNNAGIESADWIPSVNALIPLAGYFSRTGGTVSDSEARGLLFWFLLATIHARFSGSPETKLDQDLRAINGPQPLRGMLENMRHEIGSFEVTEEMIEGKYQRNPFLPLLFVIFREKKAKDWFTGTLLSSTNVGPTHQLEVHHIFPKAVLKATNKFGPREIDDVANVAFLSQKANRKILKSSPSEYLPKIEKERLRCQLVPLSEELWAIEHYRDFLTERRRMFTQSINNFLLDLGHEWFDEKSRAHGSDDL